MTDRADKEQYPYEGKTMTADTVMDATEVAQTLVKHLGGRAMLYVDDQVKAALDANDWRRVKAWREVGADVEKLLSLRFFNPYIRSPNSVH
jgi:hypothetical protein